MNDDLEKKILNKKAAVSSDAFLAKRQFDTDKKSSDQLNGVDEDYYPELEELRHELKLMMSLFSQSKFDDIVHLIANPSRLMGLNFIIGFFRGLALFNRNYYFTYNFGVFFKLANCHWFVSCSQIDVLFLF